MLGLAIIIAIGNLGLTSFAATGNQGYAIYRDGALFGIDWHAGLMDEPSTSYYKPVTHIGGLNQGVTFATWGEFMKNSSNTFKGVYRPNSYISSLGRDKVVSMGRKLITEDLGYTPLSQIDHFVFSSNNWVYPEDLWLIRCDGVVEYCYEWHGYRIYGSDSLWNISRGGFATLDHHSGTLVTPRKQSQNHMTLVQTTKP